MTFLLIPSMPPVNSTHNTLSGQFDLAQSWPFMPQRRSVELVVEPLVTSSAVIISPTFGLILTAVTGPECPIKERTYDNRFKSQMIHVRSQEPLKITLHSWDT